MTVPGIEDMTDTTVEASPVEASPVEASPAEASPAEAQLRTHCAGRDVHQRDGGAIPPLLDRAR